MGRCSDYILQDRGDVLNVFIHSPMDFKVERSVREHGLKPSEAASILTKRDKGRSHHYNFYTNQTWGMARNYHLSLDSGLLGVETCVDLICQAFQA